MATLDVRMHKGDAKGRGKGAKGKGSIPCRYGEHCTRADCVFRHPPLHPPPPPPPPPPPAPPAAAPRPPAAAAAPRPPAAAAAPQQPVSPRIFGTVDVGQEICDQLAGGMLYQLNYFLRRNELQGRLLKERRKVELLMLNPEVAVPAQIYDEIQEEVLRLSSLRQEVTDFIPIAPEMVPRFIGPKGHICRMLSRDLGVEIRVENATATVEITGVPGVMERAREAIQKHLIDLMEKPRFQSLCEILYGGEKQDVVHAFVDNSNISLGCQYLPNGTRDFSQRINIQKFDELLKGAREVGRRVVVGSKPPRTHAIWQRWEEADYQVLVEWRDPETNREQFVDARLVGEALMHVEAIEAKKRRGEIDDKIRHVFALCTGDGNLDGQRAGTTGANFQNLVRSVAERGWRVEVWCWRNTCSSAYKRLAADENLHVKLCFLDGLRNKITMTSKAKVDSVDQEDLEDLCAQCMSNVPTHAFQPCNHRILCADCALEVVPHRGRLPLGLCFICRTEWTAIVG